MLDCQSRSVGLPPECAPSPRCLARTQAGIRSSTDRYRKLAVDHALKRSTVGVETGDTSSRPHVDPDAAVTTSAPHVHAIRRRSYPVVHPPCEIPFCETCRQVDADMAAAVSEEIGHHSPSPQTPVSDDDESRSWIFKQLPGPWWWCEDCQALVGSPDITISHLFAVLRQWTPYAQLQLITIVDEILRRGAHVDDRDGLTDMTLLHFVAKSGALGDEESACRIAEFLLQSGADLEARCRLTDMTPLHYAAYFDCPMLVGLLIQHGAQLEARSRLADGATPLHLAATQLSLGSARALLHASAVSLAQTKSGSFADKDSLDALGRTPYQCLPPANQLAEPLCSLRDRLAELLGPAVRQSNALDQFATIGAASDLTPSDLLARTMDSSSLTLPAKCNGSDSQPSQSSTTQEGTSWLVAESGYLSPRVPRTLPIEQQLTPSAQSPATLPRPATAPARPITLNHPLPPTSSISAKVTLQSLGLALDDRVCIGPGNTSNATVKSKLDRDPDRLGPVAVNGRIGRLRYCGPVAFASGVWVGVELDEPLGRNNGTVAGVQYFSCAPNHGVFAPIGRVYKAVSTGTNPQQQTQQQWLPVREAASKHQSGTPHKHRGRQSPGRDGSSDDLTARPPVRVSHSSYSLSGSLSSNENETKSQLSGSVVSHPSVDISHVKAKVDTGLHVRSPDMSASSRQLELGDRVLVAGQRKGVIRFIGLTQFAPGIWYGVELDQAVGKNNGSVAGVRYFECAPSHGIFAPLNRLQRLPNQSRSATPQCGRANERHASMTGSLYGAQTISGQRLDRPAPRLAWSTTTSPMVGRATVVRPTLPQELIAALHAAGHTLEEIKDPPVFYLSEGMQVLCAGEIGTLRYIGPITFADGIWLGVELRKPRGRHDGSVGGKRYFTCRPGHGLLVRPMRVFCRGINAVDLLPPPLAAIERELAEKRQAKAQQPADNAPPE